MPAATSVTDTATPAEAPSETPTGEENPPEDPAAAPETASPEAATDMASLPPSPEAEQMAAALVDELSSGMYRNIEARLGPELRKLIPQDSLKIQWNETSIQLGEFQSIQQSAGRKVPKDGQVYDYAELVLQFARGTAVLMVAFDSEKQIVQLTLVPGQATERGAEIPATPSQSGRGSANMDILPPTAPTETLGF